MIAAGSEVDMDLLGMVHRQSQTGSSKAITQISDSMAEKKQKKKEKRKKKKDIKKERMLS